MTKQEYLGGKAEAGMKLHTSNGVVWQSTKTGYCTTAVPFEVIQDLSKKPKLSKAFVGLNHRVADGIKPTGFWRPFILRDNDLITWSIDNLESGNRRRRIRKGLLNNEVIKVLNIKDYKDDFSRILKSTAIRNGHGNPPEYYDMNKSSWWDVLLNLQKYTEFWCAFQDGKMSAYICIHVIDNRVVVDGVKSDTDMLPLCPIDAIIYNIITSVQSRGVNEMWYGGESSRPTLDKFKESYGFKVESIPYLTYFFGGWLRMPRALNKYIKRSAS